MRMWFGRKFNDDMGPNGRGARSHTRPFPHERSSSAPLAQLDDALFDDFAEMTSLAGINEDFPRRRHARECSSFGAWFPTDRVPDRVPDEDGVEFRDGPSRKSTFRKDDPRDGSGEATGARDCFGRSR